MHGAHLALTRCGAGAGFACDRLIASLGQVDRAPAPRLRDGDPQLEAILERLGLNRYLENCRRECIDDACLDTLERDDIRELGPPIGPARRFEPRSPTAEKQAPAGAP